MNEKVKRIHIKNGCEKLTTPNRKAILELAKQNWHNDRAKNGDPAFNIEPELNELQESGYLSVAQSELMRDTHRSAIESDFIDYPNEFSININELMKGNALVLGSRGIGKSDVGMRIAEKAMSNDMICVTFDPSQDWQNRSSIPSFQTLRNSFVTTIPIESTVYDISLLSPREHQHVVESFSEKLFRQQAETPNRKKYLIVFEESHTYFPQGCMRAKAYQNTVKLLSVGRNLDISCLLISQFASMLDKFAIKHSVSQAYLGFTKEFNDLKYLKSLLGSNVEQLTKLNDGEFLYLTRNSLQKIQIEPYNSTTPKTEISTKIPQLEPIQQLPKQNNAQAISTLIVALIWFIAVLLMLSQGR